jgi:hypothetical protein
MAPRRPRGTTVVLLTPERVLTPERMLARASRRFLAERTSACVKCGSRFIVHEPAFIHCRYCGSIARIANRSLLEQEEFELRSGLRVAS